jgi:hypothetical protein
MPPRRGPRPPAPVADGPIGGPARHAVARPMAELSTSSVPSDTLRIGAVLAVSWTGQLLHDRLSLPGLPLLSAETVGPGIAAMLLLAIAVARRADGLAALLLLAWGSLNLAVGAVLTVLPLPILPFEPEQTLAHYLAHVLYGIFQLPLIWVAWRALSTSRGHRRMGG